MLLSAADGYYNASPKDVLQTAEKLWLSASHSVILFCAKAKLLVSSHGSMRAAVEIACQFETTENSDKLWYAWKQAEL